MQGWALDRFGDQIGGPLKEHVEVAASADPAEEGAQVGRRRRAVDIRAGTEPKSRAGSEDILA